MFCVYPSREVLEHICPITAHQRQEAAPAQASAPDQGLIAFNDSLTKDLQTLAGITLDMASFPPDELQFCASFVFFLLNVILGGKVSRLWSKGRC